MSGGPKERDSSIFFSIIVVSLKIHKNFLYTTHVTMVQRLRGGLPELFCSTTTSRYPLAILNNISDPNGLAVHHLLREPCYCSYPLCSSDDIAPLEDDRLSSVMLILIEGKSNSSADNAFYLCWESLIYYNCILLRNTGIMGNLSI